MSTMVLILNTSGKDDSFLVELAGKFVQQNTLLIDKAEMFQAADAGDVARDDPTTTVRLSGKIATLLGE